MRWEWQHCQAFPLGVVLNYALGLVCSRPTRLWSCSQSGDLELSTEPSLVGQTWPSFLPSSSHKSSQTFGIRQCPLPLQIPPVIAHFLFHFSQRICAATVTSHNWAANPRVWTTMLNTDSTFCACRENEAIEQGLCHQDACSSDLKGCNNFRDNLFKWKLLAILRLLSRMATTMDPATSSGKSLSGIPAFAFLANIPWGWETTPVVKFGFWMKKMGLWRLKFHVPCVVGPISGALEMVSHAILLKEVRGQGRAG